MKRPIGIGAAIKSFRKSKGWTQAYLAEQLELRLGDSRPIAPAVIANWEREVHTPEDHRLRVIEDMIGVEPGTFLVRKWFRQLAEQRISIPHKLAKSLESYTDDESPVRTRRRRQAPQVHL